MTDIGRISRRTMLRGVGAAIALPFLDVMEPIAKCAAATTATAAKPINRMLYLYFPNGIARGTWYPRKYGADGRLIQLNEWMDPLEPFKEDILIPSNVWTPKGNGHGAGSATWLTGRGYNRRKANSGGASVDQVAAKVVGQETLLPSLELSTKGEGFFSNSLPRNCQSWSETGIPIPREVEPRAIFDRMFRPPTGGATNKSVLDLSACRREIPAEIRESCG